MDQRVLLLYSSGRIYRRSIDTIRDCYGLENTELIVPDDPNTPDFPRFPSDRIHVLDSAGQFDPDLAREAIDSCNHERYDRAIFLGNPDDPQAYFNVETLARRLPVEITSVMDGEGNEHELGQFGFYYRWVRAVLPWNFDSSVLPPFLNNLINRYSNSRHPVPSGKDPTVNRTLNRENGIEVELMREGYTVTYSPPVSVQDELPVPFQPDDGTQFSGFFPPEVEQLQVEAGDSNQVRRPETFVLNLRNGRIWSEHGAVISPGNNLLRYVSREEGDDGTPDRTHSIFSRNHLPPPEPFEGVGVVLSTFGRGFCSTLHQQLPRIALVREAGFKPDDLDHVFVGQMHPPYKRELFDLIDVRNEQIVELRDRTHCQVEQLLVPSLVGPSSRNVSVHLPKWTVEYLRARAGLNSRNGTRKLYVSREKARWRHIENRAEVEEILEDNGFERIFLEEETLERQIELCGQAESIVALHGAGLGNLVFCPPNTTVLELIPETYPRASFWITASQTGLEYHCLICNAVHVDEGDTPLVLPNAADNVLVDPDRLIEALDDAGMTE